MDCTAAAFTFSLVSMWNSIAIRHSSGNILLFDIQDKLFNLSNSTLVSPNLGNKRLYCRQIMKYRILSGQIRSAVSPAVKDRHHFPNCLTIR